MSDNNKADIPSVIPATPIADFEQYKLYWEALDRLSQRRSTASSFALTANSALLGIAGVLKTNLQDHGILLISVSGIMVSLVWFFQILSNRRIIKAKFKVIHELEEQLNFKLFRREWELISDHRGYQIWPNAFLEQLFPIVFIIIFAITAISDY